MGHGTAPGPSPLRVLAGRVRRPRPARAAREPDVAAASRRRAHGRTPPGVSPLRASLPHAAACALSETVAITTKVVATGLIALYWLPEFTSGLVP